MRSYIENEQFFCDFIQTDFILCFNIWFGFKKENTILRSFIEINRCRRFYRLKSGANTSTQTDFIICFSVWFGFKKEKEKREWKYSFLWQFIEKKQWSAIFTTKKNFFYMFFHTHNVNRTVLPAKLYSLLTSNSVSRN